MPGVHTHTLVCNAKQWGRAGQSPAAAPAPQQMWGCREPGSRHRAQGPSPACPVLRVWHQEVVGVGAEETTREEAAGHPKPISAGKETDGSG